MRRQITLTRPEKVRDGQAGPGKLAGSMNFVYLHVVLFTVWMLFIESKP
jgi:uncharacterized membrane protein